MRIISGKFKSRKLKAPKDIKPTKDSVKETIFNIIGDRIKNAVVLDLFAGSGTLGLEALSRGAYRLYLVDRNIKAIKKNIETLSSNLYENIEIFKRDAFSFIQRAKKKGLEFSFIFADPPYYQGLAKKCLHKIYKYDILQSNGFIIIEHERMTNLPQTIGRFELMRIISAGITQVSFYKKEGKA